MTSQGGTFLNRKLILRSYGSEAFRPHYDDFVTEKINSPSKRRNVLMDGRWRKKF